ncbi:hypothetical protein [Longimicrobium sp.]|uniref:hypothetical protein n=1 Tax=Longimicrobium sp. TaxID=2029185 RepID=UPI002CDE27B3|nr:hypothetical protein [Longimicrobium sp.]HSU16775.1 hypothetical protein [Longimicrobium sp.]
MKKLSLSPEHLRVESFPTGAVPAAGRGTVAGHVTGRPYTCPECANSSPYATCALAEIVTTRPQRTCPECANTGPYATCD